jgi:hypothetical protein
VTPRRSPPPPTTQKHESAGTTNPTTAEIPTIWCSQSHGKYVSTFERRFFSFEYRQPIPIEGNKPISVGHKASCCGKSQEHKHGSAGTTNPTTAEIPTIFCSQSHGKYVSTFKRRFFSFEYRQQIPI